jgi:murein tripeptide amidase MpaA
MKRWCWIGLGVVALASWASAESIPPLHILKVSAPDKEAYVRLFSMGLDLPEALPGPDVTVIGTDAEKEWLEAQGYHVEYELRDATRFFATRAQAAGAATMGGFRTLSETWAAVDSLVALYPNIVSTKLLIGTTLESRPIYAIRISDHPNTDEGEPAVLFTGLHHAREPISTHIVLYTMQQLATNYGTDSLITALVNEREIWFVPFVNPDGYAFNEEISPAGGGMWRKNRRNSGSGNWGVDVNRNYGDHWGFDNLGSSPSPADETYRGPGPFSERETQAVRDFVTAHPNIRIAFNYHSYSNLLLWAPGYQQFYAPDHTLMAAIADSATSWNHYTATPGWGLYVTNGDSDDWMYFQRGILSYTPEVGTPADYFWPNPGRIAPLTEENYPANLFIMQIADAPERVLPPQPAVWDSIALVGTDSLGLYWTAHDSVSINKPVNFRVRELFGPQQVMDGLETDGSLWALSGFVRTSAVAYQGTYSLYSGTGDNYTATAQLREPFQVKAGDTLRCFMIYGIETDWDYAYLEVSSDQGTSWHSVPGNLTTTENLHGQNLGFGITGTSNGNWVPAWFDLSDYAGQEVLARFAYRTDGATNYFGLYIDNINPVLQFDSSALAATTAAQEAVLADHPDGDYYFRIESVDAQGQTSNSSTRSFSYAVHPKYTLGDVDNNGTITSADIVRLVNFVFKAGPPPQPVWEAGDVDRSGAITAGDIIFLVNYVFKGGPAPGTT